MRKHADGLKIKKYLDEGYTLRQAIKFAYPGMTDKEVAEYMSTNNLEKEAQEIRTNAFEDELFKLAGKSGGFAKIIAKIKGAGKTTDEVAQNFGNAIIKALQRATLKVKGKPKKGTKIRKAVQYNPGSKAKRSAGYGTAAAGTLAAGYGVKKVID